MFSVPRKGVIGAACVKWCAQSDIMYIRYLPQYPFLFFLSFFWNDAPILISCIFNIPHNILSIFFLSFEMTLLSCIFDISHNILSFFFFLLKWCPDPDIMYIRYPPHIILSFFLSFEMMHQPWYHVYSISSTKPFTFTSKWICWFSKSAQLSGPLCLLGNVFFERERIEVVKNQFCSHSTPRGRMNSSGGKTKLAICSRKWAAPTDLCPHQTPYL